MNVKNMLDRSWREEGRVPPPALFAGAWLAQSVISSRRSGPLSKLVGAVIGGASIGLAASAAADFARRGTSLDPLVPDASELVTTGANSISRNPMYTGLVGMLVARAVSRRSMRALVPAAAVAVLLGTRQVPVEEKVLADRFGTEYETYRSSTPRWLDARSVAATRAVLPEDSARLVPEGLREKIPADLPETVREKINAAAPAVREKVAAAVPPKVREKLPEAVRDLLDDDGDGDDRGDEVSETATPR